MSEKKFSFGSAKTEHEVTAGRPRAILVKLRERRVLRRVGNK